MIEVFLNMITISFLTPLWYVFSFSRGWKLFKYLREKRKGDRSKLTQGQANLLLEGPHIDALFMAKSYANLMLLFLMTIFYFPLMPYIPFIAFLGSLFQFWCFKLMFIWSHKAPEYMGSFLAYFFSNSIPYFMILYGVSNFFWLAALRGNNEVGVVSIFTTVFYLILPLKTLFDRISKPLFKKGKN